MTYAEISVAEGRACRVPDDATGASEFSTTQNQVTDSLWSTRIARSFLLRHPNAVTYDSGSPDRKWNYEQGLMLVALLEQWRHSGDGRYFEFVEKNLDQYVDSTGRIATYRLTDYNLDNIGPGRALLAVYKKTKQEKYLAAADTLKRQLEEQPRTEEGGFWHKKIYPYQMWLDGLFMAQPFAAWYAAMFKQPEAFDDIANQFIWVARHTYDPDTGLYYHAWDESKQQQWADPETGHSPNFWARAMGWYAMALVDVLDFFPRSHPKRETLVEILRTLARGVARFQDSSSGLWYQVVDQGERKGNYLEASASCMFAYALAKGVNLGCLDRSYFAVAERAFQGIIDSLVTVDQNGYIDLHRTCRGAGLGGKPYRDGSFEYYVSEPTRTNDMKGIGPFLLAAIELERGRASTETGGSVR
jgi:unsaturated rhamnogalacturonyl hydrolase